MASMANTTKRNEIMQFIGLFPIPIKFPKGNDVVNIKSDLPCLFVAMLAMIVISLKGKFTMARPSRAIIRLISTFITWMVFWLHSNKFIPAIQRAKTCDTFSRVSMTGYLEFLTTEFTDIYNQWFSKFQNRLTNFCFTYMSPPFNRVREKTPFITDSLTFCRASSIFPDCRRINIKRFSAYRTYLVNTFKCFALTSHNTNYSIRVIH